MVISFSLDEEDLDKSKTAADIQIPWFKTLVSLQIIGINCSVCPSFIRKTLKIFSIFSSIPTVRTATFSTFPSSTEARTSSSLVLSRWISRTSNSLRELQSHLSFKCWFVFPRFILHISILVLLDPSPPNILCFRLVLQGLLFCGQTSLIDTYLDYNSWSSPTSSLTSSFDFEAMHSITYTNLHPTNIMIQLPDAVWWNFAHTISASSDPNLVPCSSACKPSNLRFLHYPATCPLTLASSSFTFTLILINWNLNPHKIKMSRC